MPETQLPWRLNLRMKEAEAVVTRTTLVRYVVCLDCCEVVAVVRTRDLDRMARQICGACRTHRSRSRHREFRVVDGRLEARTEAQE